MKNMIFNISTNGYSIEEVDNYLETQEYKIAELNSEKLKLSLENDELKEERDRLFNNCVLLAKKIRENEEKNSSAEAFAAPPAPVKTAVDYVPALNEKIDFEALKSDLVNYVETACDSIRATMNIITAQAENIVTDSIIQSDLLLNDAKEKASSIQNDAERKVKLSEDETETIKSKLREAYEELTSIIEAN